MEDGASDDRLRDAAMDGGTPSKRLAPDNGSSSAKKAARITPRTRATPTSSLAGSEPSGGDSNDPDLVSRECLGCYRVQGVDQSWFAPNVPVGRCLADRNTIWCRDCVSLYRIAFKQRMQLGVFGRWLCSSDQNRLKWLRALVSFLSLRQEGVSSVSQDSLARRERMLNWFCSMIGVPWPSFEVVEASQSFMENLSEGAAEHYLVDCAVGDAAGYAMKGLRPSQLPVYPRSSSRRYLTKAQALRQWPLIPRIALPSDFSNDWEQHIVQNGAAFQMTPSSDIDGDDHDMGHLTVSPKRNSASNKLETSVHCIEESIVCVGVFMMPPISPL